MHKNIEIRSRENVTNNGEVFTPTKIVKEMLELIPPEAWKNPSYCFLEPTCGNGQFLVEVLLKRLRNGLSAEQSLNTLIGMDITAINIEESIDRLYQTAVESGDLSEKQKLRILAILYNNIFKVDDSLKLMKEYGEKKGELYNKKFVYDDPTGNDRVIFKG